MGHWACPPGGGARQVLTQMWTEDTKSNQRMLERGTQWESDMLPKADEAPCREVSVWSLGLCVSTPSASESMRGSEGHFVAFAGRKYIADESHGNWIARTSRSECFPNKSRVFSSLSLPWKSGWHTRWQSLNTAAIIIALFFNVYYFAFLFFFNFILFLNFT